MSFEYYAGRIDFSYENHKLGSKRVLGIARNFYWSSSNAELIAEIQATQARTRASQPIISNHVSPIFDHSKFVRAEACHADRHGQEASITICRRGIRRSM